MVQSIASIYGHVFGPELENHGPKFHVCEHFSQCFKVSRKFSRSERRKLVFSTRGIRWFSPFPPRETQNVREVARTKACILRIYRREMGISLAGIGQKLGFHLSSWVIYQAGIGQKDEIVGKWSIHRKIICAPKNKFETLFLTWVFTRNRELGSHMVLQRPPDILTSIGYTTSMRILCFTLVGVIIWKSQRKKNTPKNEHSCTHPARIHGNYTKRHFLPFECKTTQHPPK